MDLLSVLVVLASLFVGWNLGANDAANAIGALVGSGTMRFRRAVAVFMIFAILGAVIQGGNIIKTTASEILPQPEIENNKKIALATLLGAGIFVFILTLFGIPVSMTQAIVGGIVGSGVAVGLQNQIDFALVLRIAASWILTFLGSMALAFFTYVLVLAPISRRMNVITFNTIFRILGIVVAVFLAYDLGANSLANAIGPILGAKVLDGFFGDFLTAQIAASLLVGIALGLGAITFGGGVVDTLGKKITTLGPVTAFTAQFAAALGVYVFVVIGIPVSTTQAIVGGVVGVGLTKSTKTVDTGTLGQILIGWIMTPVASAFLALGIYKLILIV